MGLEVRNRREYYYRKERQGNRVRSVYVGGGVLADHYGILELQRKVEAIEKRAMLEAEREEQLEIDRPIIQYGAIAKAVSTSLLLLNGYHIHSRTWRKKRNATKAEE